MTVALALIALAIGCESAPRPPSAPVVSAESSARAGVAPASSAPTSDPASSAGGAPAAERSCDVGLWDADARTCAIPPRGSNDAPGGWAGCTQASAPQGGPCFTGTRWVKADCECVCDGTTTWSEEARRCM